jgi:transposase
MPKGVAGLARRVEVFTGAGRRRDWSSEQKAAIIAESYGGDVSVCDVARRHGLTPLRLFTWRRNARRQGAKGEEPDAFFVPAVVDEEAGTSDAFVRMRPWARRRRF